MREGAVDGCSVALGQLHSREIKQKHWGQRQCRPPGCRSTRAWGWGVRVRCCGVSCAGRGEGVRVCPLTVATALPPVTQLQLTLASVQELLTQQQQKVQELAHELATAKVLAPTRGSLQVCLARARPLPLVRCVRGV